MHMVLTYSHTSPVIDVIGSIANLSQLSFRVPHAPLRRGASTFIVCLIEHMLHLTVKKVFNAVSQSSLEQENQ